MTNKFGIRIQTHRSVSELSFGRRNLLVFAVSRRFSSSSSLPVNVVCKRFVLSHGIQSRIHPFVVIQLNWSGEKWWFVGCFFAIYTISYSTDERTAHPQQQTMLIDHHELAYFFPRICLPIYLRESLNNYLALTEMTTVFRSLSLYLFPVLQKAAV